MRLFVAVELDDNSRAFVAAEQQRVAARLRRTKSSLRLIDPQQVHLTLAFLGEIAAPTSDVLIETMRQPISDVAPFRLAIGGLGMFPPRGAPRILWLGISEGARETVVLQAAVARRLSALDITLEERVFRPHVTIGRWRNGRPSDRLSVDDLPSAGRADVVVDQVTLFESRLSSQGASHIPLAQARLSPTP